MKKFVILLSLLVIVFRFFLNPGQAKVEAGLSEAGRIEFYKLNDKYEIEVLPGGAVDLDDISIYAYKENHNYYTLTGPFCQGKYIRDDEIQVINFLGEVYIKGDYIFDDLQVFNVKTGKYFSEWDKPPYTNVNLHDALDLDKNNAEKFDLQYIRNHYQAIDMNNLQEFSCGISTIFILTLSLLVVCIVIIVLIILAFVLRKRLLK